MKKITTLFKKDPTNLSRVTNEINPENSWVFDEGVKATQKFDGTACAIIDGVLYKRYDVKKGREVPPDAIPCQEPDIITGHWPHWIPCYIDKADDKWHFEGLHNLSVNEDGTYELCGPKIQGNPEKLEKHTLLKHGSKECGFLAKDFKSINYYLDLFDIEGIVFHHPDGRMCKIRKSDFGIKR